MPRSPTTQRRSARSPTPTVSARGSHRPRRDPAVTLPWPAAPALPIAGDSGCCAGCSSWERNSPRPVAALRGTKPHGQHGRMALSLWLCLEMAHFASSGDGLVVTLDKESGEVLWAQNYGSPVVGIYVWHQDSLRRVPHLNLAMETLRYLTFHSQDIPLLRWSYQAVRDFAATKTQLLYVAPVLWQPAAAALFVLGRPEPWRVEG